MNINPVIGMCRKVDALIRVQTDRVQTEDKPKKKSKGFVVRNIAEDTQPRNKDSKSCLLYTSPSPRDRG